MGKSRSSAPDVTELEGIGPLVDSHAHLTDKRFRDDRAEVMERARLAGVETVVTIGAGYGIDRNQRALDLAAASPDLLRATVGVHPHDAHTHWSDAAPERLADWLGSPLVVGLGECGLDYFYHQEPEVQAAQRRALAAQCELAVRTGMPLIIHTRDAFEDTMAILRDHEVGRAVDCVIHFFVTTRAEAEAYLELGPRMWLSIPGVVTLPNAPDLVAAVPHLPLERIFLETDSPYAAPVPRRGRRNEPANVRWVAERVAELQQRDPAEVARVTTANARAFYHLDERQERPE